MKGNGEKKIPDNYNEGHSHVNANTETSLEQARDSKKSAQTYMALKETCLTRIFRSFSHKKLAMAFSKQMLLILNSVYRSF